MYSIAADPERRLITGKLSGFLSPEEAQAFARDEQDAIRNHGWGTGGYDVLVDTTECMLQLQEVVSVLQELVANAPYKARRVALVNGQSGFKMQLRRILARKDAAIFETEADARAWLLE